MATVGVAATTVGVAAATVGVAAATVGVFVAKDALGVVVTELVLLAVEVDVKNIPSMRMPTSGLLSRLPQFVQLPPALLEYPAFRIWTVLPQAIGKLPAPHAGPLLGSLKFGKLMLNRITRANPKPVPSPSGKLRLVGIEFGYHWLLLLKQPEAQRF